MPEAWLKNRFCVAMGPLCARTASEANASSMANARRRLAVTVLVRGVFICRAPSLRVSRIGVFFAHAALGIPVVVPGVRLLHALVENERHGLAGRQGLDRLEHHVLGRLVGP